MKSVVYCLIEVLLFHLATAYNQNPKLYVDVECIEFIDPLLHGFDVHIPATLRKNYLGPFNSPLVYATAIPLDNRPDAAQEPIRKKLFSDHIQNSIVKIRDLRAKSWYYVCIEFENMHRDHRQGNTSTSCRLVRTLDTFGKSATTVVADVGLSLVSDTIMDFQLGLDTSFPLMLDVFLEEGPTALRTFHVSQPKSIRVRFDGLSSSRNYGRLCVREVPLLVSYTAMGRSVHVDHSDCYLERLRTDRERPPEMAFVRASRDVVQSSAAHNIYFRHAVFVTAAAVVLTICAY